MGSAGGGDGCLPTNYALAVAACTYTKGVEHTYRTRGLFTIYWDSGDVTAGAGPFYSPTWTGNYSCD